MKNRLTTPMLASIGAFVLMLALFFSFYFSTSTYRSETSGIILPSQNTGELILSEQEEPDEKSSLVHVEITKENVQDVIRSLKRPQTYSQTIRNTITYGERTHTLARRQYVKDGACRTDELGSGDLVQRSSLRYSGKLYVWESGAAHYLEAAAGSFADDEDAMLPTYENVLALANEAIIATGIQNLNYVPCIYVRALEDEFICDYYISTITGLLVRADVYDGEQLLRSCEIVSVSTNAPADSFFTIPGGKFILENEG